MTGIKLMANIKKAGLGEMSGLLAKILMLDFDQQLMIVLPAGRNS